MPSYKLSAEAVRDIEGIGENGMSKFGLAQALRYHLGLESRFELLAEFPRIGLPTYDLRAGLYRWSYQSHTIFYMIDPNDLLIVRVLPARADFKRYF